MTTAIPPLLAARLREAKRVVVLTGAGVSAESKIPTFRDAQTGLWAQYRPEELATPEAFARQPKLVWEWYAWRRALCAKSEPNPGHYALVELAKRVPVLTLVTQNVDNLHQRAGSPEVIELHGNITRIKCAGCGALAASWSEEGELPPRCACGGLLRPDVVWFGESLPTAQLARAIDETRRCDLFFSVGTSGLVHPAASLPYQAPKSALVVEINPDRTPLSDDAGLHLAGPSGVLLPSLLSFL